MSENSVVMNFEGSGDLPEFLDRINAALNDTDKASDKAKSSSSKLNPAVANLASAFSAAAVAAKAMSFAVSAVNNAMGNAMAAAKLEQVVRATGGAAGFTAKQLEEMGAALHQNSIHSSTAVTEAQAMLLTFKEISGDVFPRAMTAIGDMSMLFGGLESSAMQVGKALNDPVEGISALSRVGIRFTDEQKKMIESMVAAGDTAGAQAVILKELEGQFSGVAKAIADTPAGKLKALKNEYGDLQATLGEKLIPALVVFQQTLNDITRFMGDNVEVAIGLVAGGLVLLIPVIKTVTVAIIAKTAAMMANPLFAAAAGIVAGVTAVAGALKHISKNSKEVAEEVEVMGNVVAQTVNKFSALHKSVNDFLDAKAEERLPEHEKALRKLSGEYYEHSAAVQGAIIETKNLIAARESFLRSLGYSMNDSTLNNLKAQLAGLEEAQTELSRSHNKERVKINSEAFKSIREAREKALRDMELDMMSAEARELSTLQETYTERTKLFKNNADAIVKLTEWEEAQRTGIVNRYEAERIAAAEAELERVTKMQEAHRALIEQQEKQKTDAQIAAMTKVTAHEIGQWETRRRTVESEAAKMRSLYGVGSSEYVRITAWASDQIKEINEQQAAHEDNLREQAKRKREEDQRDMVASYIAWGESAISVINSIASVSANANANRMKEIEEATRKEIEAVNNSRMSNRAKASETARLEQEAAKAKYDVAVSQWKTDVALAYVNTAAAVTKTMASVPFPANIPLAVAQGVAGGAQIAIAQANKPKMQFGGFIQGQSWSGDQVDIRANSGEAVLTPAQQRQFMFMANGGRGGETRSVNMGETNIVINGAADTNTVNAINQSLQDHRASLLEMLYEANQRGEIDRHRLGWGYI